MVKQKLLIRVLEEKTSRKSGEKFYTLQTNKGDYTCFEPDIMKKLDPCIGKTVEVETVESGRYNNIRQFYGVVEAKAEAAKSGGNAGGVKIEMLVSYAKDLVIAGKEETMEKAIASVIGAYQKTSEKLQKMKINLGKLEAELKRNGKKFVRVKTVLEIIRRLHKKRAALLKQDSFNQMAEQTYVKAYSRKYFDNQDDARKYAIKLLEAGLTFLSIGIEKDQMAEEIENTQEQTHEQKSSVKVSKNSRGYNWEVKVYDDDVDKALSGLIRIEQECQKKYGEKPEA